MNVIVRDIEKVKVVNHHDNNPELDEKLHSMILNPNEQENMKHMNLERSMFGESLLNVSRRASVSRFDSFGQPIHSRVAVETSIISNEVFMTEAIDPSLPVPIKLAYTSTINMWLGIIFLSMFIVSGSLLGPVTLILPGHNFYAKANWRAQGNFIWSLPLAIGIYAYNGEKMSFKADFCLENIKNTAINAFFLNLSNFLLIVGCAFTVSSHCIILAS